MAFTMKRNYTAKEVVAAKVQTWREMQCEYKPNFSTYDTLSYIKECCYEYDLEPEDVKEIFDGCEAPFYYDIKNDKTVNGNEEEEDEDDEE